MHRTYIVNAHWPADCPRDTTRQCVSTSSSLEAVRYNPEMFMRKKVWKYTFECSLNTLQTFMYFKFALAHIGRKDALVFVCLCVSACMSVSDCLCICVCFCVSLFGCLLFVVRTRFVQGSCKEEDLKFPCLFVYHNTIPVCGRGHPVCRPLSDWPQEPQDRGRGSEVECFSLTHKVDSLSSPFCTSSSSFVSRA